MDKIYSIKDYITTPLITKITETEAQLRHQLMKDIIKNKKPLNIKDHPQKELILKMANNNILALNQQLEIISIYPVSALPTNKKVFFPDGSYAYAMCAIDAIGFHYTFKQAIRIESHCQHCGEKIVLAIDNGKIEVLEGSDHIHILHTDLSHMQNWSCCCCNIMHFFKGKKHLQKWTKNHHLTAKPIPVDLETANKIAWLLFSS